jgi:hypothetical protein
MRFPSTKIEAVCGKKDAREFLNHVHLDRNDYGQSRLMATDGHILAVKPVEVDNEDTSGAIPAEALKRTRDICGKHLQPFMLVNGACKTIDKAEFPRPDCKMPDYRRVARQFKYSGRSVILDAKQLKQLADALNEDGSARVEIMLNVDENGANLVKPMRGKGYGLVMPISKRRR